ncbi:hypothetical protein [Aquimarina algiphila]|uniref:hypothetical protein n=1 Tax=Aquimarina algiphila TaxID=2047982 RepID=UPI00232BC453|nr:hypothetical protein [Aquimarina algiphila]
MKSTFFVIILIFISSSLFSQDYLYKLKEYDLKIFNYLIEKTKTDSTPLDKYLEFSKPFSKWDIRPLNINKVWAIDTIHSASTIPNFIWGSFSKKYNLTESQASNKPNVFLKKGTNRKKENSEFLNKKLKKFEKLTKSLIESSNQIFLNQKSILRIDDIYKENYYWTYIIPKDSPFPISNKTKILSDKEFSKKQKNILKLLSELKIYAAYKTDKGGLYLLIDGFTDNSYGFYFNSDGIMEINNDLFQIMTHEQLNSNFFYYVAN